MQPPTRDGASVRMRPLEAVVFDVDGTLVDSERHGHRVAFNEAFGLAGMADRWDEARYGDLLRVAGGRQRLLAYLEETGVSPAAAEPLAARLHTIKTNRFREMAASGAVPLVPGVRRLVSSLQRRGIRLFVATTGNPEWVGPLLEHHFGASMFERVVTAADVAELKPDPAAYLEILRSAGVSAEGVVAVEDSTNGLRAAHGAGLPCLVVRNEYTGDDVDAAELVVSAFGPHARVVSGLSAPMPHGLVTVETLEALAGSRPSAATPPRRLRRTRGRHRARR